MAAFERVLSGIPEMEQRVPNCCNGSVAAVKSVVCAEQRLKAAAAYI